MVSPSPLLRDWTVVSDDADMYRGEDCTPPYSAASQQPSTLTFPGCTKLSFSSRTFTISLQLLTDKLDLHCNCEPHFVTLVQSLLFRD